MAATPSTAPDMPSTHGGGIFLALVPCVLFSLLVAHGTVEQASLLARTLTPISPATTDALSAASTDDRSQASGLVQTVRQIGGGVMVVMAVAAFTLVRRRPVSS